MKVIKYIGIVFWFIACEDVIDLDLPENVSVVVIEGWLNDQNGPQSIRISRTTNFSNDLESPAITDAQVQIRDSFDSVFNYEHTTNGIYISDSNFVGLYDNTYQLIVVLSEGDTIKSQPETLIEVIEIDKIEYDFVLQPSPEDPSVEIPVYFPIVFASDPADQVNFYRWNFTVNDTLITDPERITLLEDRFINGSDFRNDFTNISLSEGDRVIISVQSLSAAIFNFFQLFKSQVVSQGTSGGSAPTRLVGNLINISSPETPVLGFFGVTSIKYKETTIVEVQ